MYLKKFRIAQDRYLRTHIRTEESLYFEHPSTQQIISTIFTSAGFSRLEPSETARYHKNFVDRAGSLEAAAFYLANPQYRELLEVLSNNTKEQLPGWLLKHPSQRRVLHHLQLRNLLKKETPPETHKYFDTVSDELPEEVTALLEQRILERGFLLSCKACAYSSWYPAEHVGQAFECPRCYFRQVCTSNPLWLYKLAEVVFQGFEDHMEAPLLTLNYLRNASHYHFDWIPDSDVYWREKSKDLHRNVDILCLSDGRLYVGEAKSNNDISEEQFAFYEKISTIQDVDGFVFATSQPEWNSGTLKRIERLKPPYFKGKVLCLTRRKLYSNGG